MSVSHRLGDDIRAKLCLTLENENENNGVLRPLAACVRALLHLTQPEHLRTRAFA